VDSGVLWGGVVVEHQMQVQALWAALRCRSAQKAEELLVPVLTVVLGDHRPAAHVAGGKQAGSVPHVVMGHPGRRRGQDSQARRGPSRTWIWDFSSTARTRACSGRFM
jgi:hypothetical protein